MSSSFTWLDFSEYERRKALEVIHWFKEQDTRDELGVGSIRDAFSDLLFPGTSTIQTRVRYFLFVPWTYLGLERRRTAADAFGERARQAEIKLIDALRRGGEDLGVIGILAGARLARVPSNVYWNGLARWGIRLYPGSQFNYHRAAQLSWSLRDAPEVRGDDGDLATDLSLRNWHPGLPPPPPGFPDAPLQFSLTAVESTYLRERILATAPASLLAFLVRQELDADEDVQFAWMHPDFAEFPATNKEQLVHAERFSTVMHGAALLYNLLLAEADHRAELASEYRTQFGTWAGEVVQLQDRLGDWDLARFWTIVSRAGAPIAFRARLFVQDWVSQVRRAHGSDALIDENAARQLIASRERALKGPQARLQNARALELWSGAAGTGRLNYRWPVAQRMVHEIVAGLPVHTEAASA